ncbi:uncharacterized protein LOC126840577 [Adelges cooleyi]|uniref:uncharacterized protein LOC126840577 n=1 Tax=Adelges cooleyi TaxID=133065 RepID=UPI0021807EC6|nr:uncharacterized protein LOC126840577 [Adelges cooleyi]
MAESLLCCGCITYRVATRTISILYFWCSILAMVFTIMDMRPASHNTIQKSDNSFFQSSYTGRINNHILESINTETQYLFNTVFYQLFSRFLSAYVSYYLQKATYEHNVNYIHQWLIYNKIYLVFTIVIFILGALRLDSLELVITGIPIALILMYPISIVQRFYQDELRFLASTDRSNNLTGATITVTGPPYVTLNNPGVLSPYHGTAAPSTSIIPTSHVPAQHPYPQQVYSYPTQPQAMPHLVEPHLQEFCNPPPYSPYSGSEGPSTKQET